MGIGEFEDEPRPYYDTWWFQGVMLALSFLVGWVLWQFVNLPWTQNASVSNQFIELARSIATGHGYTLNQGGQHIPYLDTPPLYSILLSILMILTGTTQMSKLAEPLMLFNLSMYALSILLVFRFLSNRIIKPYAYIITLLYTISPLTLSAVKSLTPELTYLVFSLLALVAIDKYFKDVSDISRWRLVSCCLFIVAAMMTKYLGLSLLAAFFILSWSKLGTRQAFVILTVVLLILSPWFFRDVIHRNFSSVVSRGVHHSIVTQASKYTMASPFKDPRRFGKQLTKNTDAASADVTEATLGTLNFNFLTTPTTEALNLGKWKIPFSEFQWVRWTVGSLIVVGLLFGFYQYTGIASLYLLSFMVMSVFFPLDRHLAIFPVLPLLLFYFFNGVMWIGEGFKQFQIPFCRYAVPVFTALIAINSVNNHIFSMHQDQQAIVKRPLFNETGVTQTTSDTGYLRAMRWLRSNTPSNAHIIADKPEDVKLFTQRKAQSPVKLRTEFGSSLYAKADYLVEEQNSVTSRRYVSPVLASSKDRLRLVYNDPNAQIRIWQILPKANSSKVSP